MAKAVKSYVLIQQGNHDEGVSLADQVAQSETLSSEVIDILQDIYISLGANDKLSKLFERIAPKNANNERFLRNTWFENMVHMNDYAGQQKAAMALHKLGKRQYTLWAIFGLYMAVKSGTANKTESFIFPQLATRLLEGAKPLQNAQEGYLQALIFQIRNQKKELAEFLKSEQVKTWDFLDLNVLIPPALTEVEDWEGLRDHCKWYLTEKGRDDWNHWKALIEAHSNLGSLETLIKFIQEYKASRNSMLAMIEISSLGVNEAPSYNKAVENFFNAMGTKRSTFTDLTKYVSSPAFDKAQWVEFLNKIESQDLTVRVNIENFLFLVRQEDYNLDELIVRQIQNYESTQDLLKVKDAKDYHPGDDYLLIAAYGILEKSQDKVSLEKVAVLLELAAKNDKHQFYVRLWLIRIYLLLGAYSLAKGHYKILKVSKIQHESLAHYLVTRLTTLDPDFETLYDAFEIYETGNGELTSFIMNTYEHGSFTQLESMNDLQRIMKSSVSRGIIQTEVMKTKRFKRNVQKLDSLADLQLDNLADSRDFDIMWDIPQVDKQPLSQMKSLTLGPKIGSEWIRVHQIKNNIVKDLIRGDKKLKDLADLFMESAKKAEKELTKIEYWATEAVYAVALSAMEKTKEQGYINILVKLQEADGLLKKEGSIEDHPWTYFHAVSVIMETLIIVSGYLDLLLKHKSHLLFNQSKVTELRKTLEQGLFSKVKADALNIKNNRNATVQRELDEIVPWSEKLGFTSGGFFANQVADIVDSVVEGVAIGQDQSLTYFRSISL